MVVLPVPDCAWAIVSRPFRIGMIARCWMADGFSNPARGHRRSARRKVSNATAYGPAAHALPGY
eukprot:scaffold18296_cov124-Isochrysis_galbana.AAC.3